MEKIELKAHKPKPNRMTSIEENVQLARIQQASTVSSSAIYERKPNQKALKVLTVAAYILFVSMAAITLSFYYVFIWDPAATIVKPPLLPSPAPGTNGKGAVICDTKIIIPENVAVRLANSTKVTAEKFYKYIYQNYQHPGANGRARADRVDVIDTIAATDEPIEDDDDAAEDHRQRDPYESEPRSTDGIIASRIVVGPPDEPPLPLARMKERLATATTTDLPATGQSTSTALDVQQYADDEYKSPTLKASPSPQIVAAARWGYDDTEEEEDGEADEVIDHIGADAAEHMQRDDWTNNQRKQRRNLRKPMLDVDAEDAGDDDDDRDADGDDFEASGGLVRGDHRTHLSVGNSNGTEVNKAPLRDRGADADGDADGSESANGL